MEKNNLKNIQKENLTCKNVDNCRKDSNVPQRKSFCKDNLKNSVSEILKRNEQESKSICQEISKNFSADTVKCKEKSEVKEKSFIKSSICNAIKEQFSSNDKLKTKSSMKSSINLSKEIVPAPQEPMLDWKSLLPEEHPLGQLLAVKYNIKNKLADYEYSRVYKCTSKKTGLTYAIKMIDTDQINPENMELFQPNELHLLTNIRHNYLIRIHQIFNAENYIFIVMDYANGGDLKQYLDKNGPLTETLACYWFTSVCRGLKHLHNNLRMAHRDIKIENILLQDNIAKLSDFTQAKRCWDLKNNRPLISTSECGTAPYFSPQKIALQPYDPFADDIWALGVVLFIMVKNEYPFGFPHVNQGQQLNESYLNKLPKKATNLKNLFNNLLMVDEAGRIKIEGVLNHKWIKRKRIPIFFKRKILRRQITRL